MGIDLLTTFADLYGKAALLLLEYLKVLAWPVLVLVLALMFKGPLVSMISRLRKASGFGASVELERDSQYLAIAAVQAEPAAEGAVEPVGEVEVQGPAGTEPEPAAGGSEERLADPVPEVVEEVVDQDVASRPSDRGSSHSFRVEWSKTMQPRLTVIANRERVRQSWARLERLSGEIGAELKLGPWKRSPADVARELAALGYGSADVVTIAMSLEKLHQKILHAQDDELFVTADTAHSFDVTVSSIMNNLQRGIDEFRAYVRGGEVDGNDVRDRATIERGYGSIIEIVRHAPGVKDVTYPHYLPARSTFWIHVNTEQSLPDEQTERAEKVVQQIETSGRMAVFDEVTESGFRVKLLR